VAGRQAYVIYPVIEESERADLKAATVMAERLARCFRRLEVGLVHGRLKAEEATRRCGRSVTTRGAHPGRHERHRSRDRRRERAGHADRARRGVRVGAAATSCGGGWAGGQRRATAILLSDIPDAAPRLQAFTETTDGFKIGRARSPRAGMGELAGARQSGGVPLRYANFATDLPLLEARAPAPRARSSRGTRRWRSHSTRRIASGSCSATSEGSSYSGWGELRR